MGIVIFAIVVIAALFAVCSGVWVAIALVRAISRHQTTQDSCHSENDTNNSGKM
ncbi:MAG: hypothetical protein GWO10_23545 [candidate division Zixibacteria bacterium]|nr:hypothetical protein [candidate division Zixibacteria bacterium]NIW96933.1 hypothetical protein [Phycisphaerae bacterium]